MSKDKKEVSEKADEVVETKAKYPIVESPEKAKFRKRLEAYETANPEAWKIRGERLQAQLESMV